MEKSSFFNSVAGDRKYKAEDFALFFNSLLTNGVFPNPSTTLQVLSNNNMTVTIKAGKAWINGYVYILDADMILNLDVADGVLKRIDRVVIRFDTVGRAINAVVKKGVFASSPVAPVLQRDADRYELGIADILINNGTVSIVQGNITDLRMNTTYCGWVNSLIQADTTAIFNQYQAWFTTQSNAYNADMIANEATFQDQFDSWFSTVQGQLNGDIAGNLAVSISDLAGTGRTTQTVKGNADAIATLSTSVATSLADKTNKNDYVANNAYAVTTGTLTTYAITLNPAPTAYADGQQFIINPHVDCGAAPTLNINSLGTGTILKQDGSAISAGDIKANKPLGLVRVGSNFFIRSGGGSNIKSIQRGALITSNATTNIPISSVDVNKSIVRITSFIPANMEMDTLPTIKLTSNNNIQVVIGLAVSIEITWEVIEFNNVKSIQRGSLAIPVNADDGFGYALRNITLSSINPLKAMVFDSIRGSTSNYMSAALGIYKSNITSNTNLEYKFLKDTAFGRNLEWQVIEFN